MDIKDKQELAQLKSLAIKKIEHLNGDSEWTLIQQIAQEIEADHKIRNQKLSLDNHVELLKQEIANRYNEDPVTRDLILEAVPSKVSVHHWKKKKGWEEAVWVKVRGEGLFTSDNRAKIIQKLYEQAAIDGNVTAAKIWLTLSGDYSEKDTSGRNEVLDVFRNLNEAIHSKK